MKVKTTISEEQEVDIELPFFRKDNTYICEKYLAVLDEKTMVSIFNSPERTNVSIDDPKTNQNEVATAFKNHNPISEESFMEAHSKALKSLSLVPQLADDLSGVNIFAGNAGEDNPDYPLLNDDK